VQQAPGLRGPLRAQAGRPYLGMGPDNPAALAQEAPDGMGCTRNPWQGTNTVNNSCHLFWRLHTECREKNRRGRWAAKAPRGRA